LRLDARRGDGGLGDLQTLRLSLLQRMTVILCRVLSKLGDRVDFGRLPLLHRRQPRGRLWGLILRPALRFPKTATLVVTAGLVALAVPTLNLKTVLPGAEDISHDVPVLQAYDRVQQAFPGGADPASIVVKAPDVTAPAVRAAIDDFRAAALATGEAYEPMTVRVNPGNTVAEISLGVVGNGTDDASRQGRANASRGRRAADPRRDSRGRDLRRRLGRGGA
jgi:putative drug exporter of the RND superfamily